MTGLPVPDVAPGTRPTRALLADGSVARLWVLGPPDAADVLALHESLPERDRYLRFSTLHPADLAGYLDRVLAPGSGSVSLGARVHGRLVGVVQLIPVGPNTGEVAAAVHHAWADHGVATVLLEQLAVVALGRGITRLVADVLAENARMLRLLHELGLPVGITRDGTSMRIEITLHPDDRYSAASEARHRSAAAASLRPVLRPESVVVVGASRDERSVGRAVLRSLRAARFPGAVFAVNPHADRVEDVPCWPTVSALPCSVDLAVVAVPAASLATVIEDCGAHGVRAVLVLTAGLGEMPGLAQRVRELADRYGMRLVGPNTVGVVGPGDEARLDTTFTERTPPSGDVGLVAQSGGVAMAVVVAWERLGLGLSAMLAIGDALDVASRDALAWFDEDPGTELVVLYAESEADLRGMARTAAHLAARVPVLALNVTTSAAGRRAAETHTARAATVRAVREAAYAAGGIQSVDDLAGVAASVALLRGQPLPGTGTVVVLTNVGGGGVLAADACAGAGLRVDPLPEDLQEQLREVLPQLAATVNPVDASATVSAAEFAAALGVLLDSPDVGAVVTVTAPTAVSDPLDDVAHLLAGRPDCPTPVVDVRLTRPTTVDRIDLPGGPPGRFVVSVADPAVAARALAVATRRRAWLDRPPGGPTVPTGVDGRAARAVVTAALAHPAEGGWLPPPEVATLCAAAGLPVAPTRWVSTPKAAVAAARRLAGPVAVKGYVAGVLHKGDAGYLRLPVGDPRGVGEAVREWAARAGADWRGAVVQPMVPPGDELLVGMVRDPSAGPVLALGPGGRASDALGHRVHRLAPLTAADLAELLAGTGLFATGHGRGLDRAAVADAVCRVGWLADALPEVAEIDVNPLVVTPEGCVALDVRLRIEPPRT